MAVWTKPRIFFSPVVVIPKAMTIESSANVLPSNTSATNSSRSRRRSHSVRSARVLARIKRRETLEALNPNASGTASAHAA